MDFDVFDGDKKIGCVEAEDKKTAKKKFFADNPKFDAERKAQKRVKCSYKIKKSE